MSDKEVDKLIEQIDAGLKLAEKRMLEEKALHEENIVVYTKGNGIQYISAKQVLTENYKD